MQDHKLGRRNIAIVGPYGSGKTSLLESLLAELGAINRPGRVDAGNTVGDSSPEARSRQMTVEINVANTDSLTFLDCPGSVEFQQETWNALIGVDGAIVVCEADPDRALTLAPIFHFLDSWEIPHCVFINKLERATEARWQATLDSLRSCCSRPLVAQQYPLFQGDRAVGFVDLISEQSHSFGEALNLPLSMAESVARNTLLETLADYDDHLLEELLEEIEPPVEEILDDLRQDVSADLIVPVLTGSAQLYWGISALLAALQQEMPTPAETVQHRRLIPCDRPVAQVLKTFFHPQAGKLSLIRLWQGELQEGDTLDGDRPSGIYRMMGDQLQSVQQARSGEIVALGRMESALTGDSLGLDAVDSPLPRVAIQTPVYALALTPERRSDEVKLGNCLRRLQEEDPSLQWEQHGDTHEVILWGQGEIHLQVALDRLRRKYTLPMSTHLPQVPFRETIRSAVSGVHGRYKHQTGGHGQFGDVYLDIQPLPRGEGFRFQETVVGGVVPRQYIPGVESGVREFLERGPLGFPLVDVEVTLTHGSYHSVDSSEQAFRQAARLAMQSGIPAAEPLLLEPILQVELFAPAVFTSSMLRLLSGHRGQILGYESCDNREGWDQVSAYLPQAEMQALGIELRSVTQGVGFFHWRHSHLAEVPERLQQQLLSDRSQ